MKERTAPTVASSSCVFCSLCGRTCGARCGVRGTGDGGEGRCHSSNQYFIIHHKLGERCESRASASSRPSHGRVQLVRRDERDVSTLYGREGGGRPARLSRGGVRHAWKKKKGSLAGCLSTSCKDKESRMIPCKQRGLNSSSSGSDQARSVPPPPPPKSAMRPGRRAHPERRRGRPGRHPSSPQAARSTCETDAACPISTE